MPIRKIKARQIFDARGEPTIEVDLVTEIGLLRTSVPSVFYPTSHGAKEFRDGVADSYNGRSVLKVVESINNIIAPEILKSKLDVNQQREIDLLMTTLDGTPDKSRFGVNAIFGISVACCKAAAAKRGLPLYRYISMLANNANEVYLPVPLFHIMSGGKLATNSLVYQEYYLMPIGAPSISEALRLCQDVYRTVENVVGELLDMKPPLPVLNEGTFAPDFEEDKEAIEMLQDAIKACGYDDKVKIGLNIAAQTFNKDEGMYDLQYKTGDSDPDDFLNPDAMLEMYEGIVQDFPNVIALGDPLAKEDWDTWDQLTAKFNQIQIIADDLTDTNTARLEEAIERNAGNSVVIRPSQIGTITEAIDCVQMAREARWSIIIAGGQVETEDVFVADFAVGTAAGQFKCGAPCRTERISKFNQLVRIEEELGKDAKYAGKKYRNPLERG